MRRVFLPWAAAAVFLLGHANASGKTKPGSASQLQVINFNFETVQITWNTSAYAGINFTFVYKSPGDLSFQWREEAVTVTCSNLGYNDLQYEIQHKTVFDAVWQSTEAETCNVTVDGLDPEKCYFFRARVKALEFAYGSETYPSDWSEVTHQQRGELRDSCWENSLFPKFILIAGMVSFLTVFLLLLSLWKLHRIKKVLMPSVPDPRFSFLGLFESHQGNFQGMRSGRGHFWEKKRLPGNGETKGPEIKANDWKDKCALQRTEVAEDAPEVAEDAPEVAEDAPEVAEDAPEVAEDAPEVAEDAPEVAEHA
ncbi:hypothetical protein MG293_020760 [Ovis ammon polii]|uniref:Cytokine receptor-like factor 2 n=1 Tax=Ovis ammon polii TaxID=230172 RepID=A0AAD4TLI8_OVIAM|nr:hypothetical protein MG293_020760 [Ovis ammon polii]